MTEGPLTLPGPLVSAEWLAAHLQHPSLVVADCRWYIDGRSGEAAYDAGHIPGAVFVDLDSDLAGSAEVGPGRHPLPSPEHFAEAMAGLGVGDDAVVVAYDDANGSIAARLWWMLHANGRRVAVLDGGISAWTGELSLDLAPRATHVTFSARPWPLESVVDAIAVDSLRRTAGAVVLDARSADRYRGEANPTDKRLGHVPGAKSAPWATSVDPATGRLRSKNELRAKFTSLGVRDDRPSVCYCGSGVTACHMVLALTVAGFSNVKLYPGSWSDWSAAPDRPVATGEES